MEEILKLILEKVDTLDGKIDTLSGKVDTLGGRMDSLEPLYRPASFVL